MSIVHPLFVLCSLLCYLCFFVLFFRHRSCDEQKVRFLYRNDAVYLRCSLWPNLFNNLTAILFFMWIFVIDLIMIDHVRHSLAKMVVTCTMINILGIRWHKKKQGHQLQVHLFFLIQWEITACYFRPKFSRYPLFEVQFSLSDITLWQVNIGLSLL